MLPIHSRGSCLCPIIDFAVSPNIISPPFGHVRTHVFVASQSDETDLNLQSNVHALFQTPLFANPKSHSSPLFVSIIPLPQCGDHPPHPDTRQAELVLHACL